MSESNNHLTNPDVLIDPDQLIIPVPWAEAEALQAHLRRHGIASTLHLDPRSGEARLELRPRRGVPIEAGKRRSEG